MKKDDDGTIVHLTPEEVDGLAMRLVVDTVREGTESGWDNLCGPEWEDVPMLAESLWEQVHKATADYARKLARDLRQWESLHDIDTVELLERAQ